MRDSILRCTYGITLEQYNALLTAQAGVCAICQSESPPYTSLAVDHCHVTGVIRALLCFPCNAGVGHYEKMRDRASAYLAVYGQGNPLLREAKI